MNVAAIRWLRWAAKVGMAVSMLYWIGLSFLNIENIATVIGSNQARASERARLLFTSFLDPLYMGLHGFMASAILYVACDIARQLRHTHHFESGE